MPAGLPSLEVRVRIPPFAPLLSARGAIGRRGTFRPCRSGFESPRADHPSVAELAYAVGSNPTMRLGLESRVHVGSNPTAGTISRGFDPLTGDHFDGGRRQTARRECVKVAGRRVTGSPPASGAGAWRFESSRPDHLHRLRSVVTRRGRSAMRPPFERNHAGSTPADGTTPGFVQRQDVRPITGESGFESSSLDHVDEVLPEAPFRPASWCGHSARPKPERTWFDPTAGHHEYPTTPRATTSPS